MKELLPTGSHFSRSFEMNLGLQNYGMRMYDNAIGRFTTTDRFADKYATMSPYQYGANNPVKYVDVNGDSIRIGNHVWTPGAKYNGKDKFIQVVFDELNALVGDIVQSDAGNVETQEAEGNVLLDFVGSDKNVEIVETNGSSITDEDGKIIHWNPNETILVTKPHKSQKSVKDKEGLISAGTVLFHEFGHSWLSQFSPKLNHKFENQVITKHTQETDPEHNLFILPRVENKLALYRKEGIRFKYNSTTLKMDVSKETIPLNYNTYRSKIDIRIITKP